MDIPAQPPTESPPQPALKQSFILPIFLSLLSLLLLLSTAYLGYQNMQLTKQVRELSTPTLNLLATPTPKTDDPMASWKTYTNTTYGFSLKYPSDSQLSNESPDGQSVYIVPIAYDTMDDAERAGTSVININVLSSDSQSPFTAASFAASANSPGYSNKRNMTPITVDGHTAIQFMSNNTQVGGNDEIHTVIETNQKNTLILISVSAQGNTDPLIFPGQILSTFTFTGKDEIPVISEVELSRGWYWGSIDQKKLRTPTDWVFLEAGRSSCWHKPGVTCTVTSYTCPENGWVDCEPVLEGTRKQACSAEAMDWYKTNCPNFQGGAL